MRDSWDSSYFWEELLDFVQEGRIIPVLGWDLLTVKDGGENVALMRYLAQKLATKLEVSADDLPSGNELNTIACRHLAQRGEIERLYSRLKRLFPKEEDLEIPEALTKLAKIKPLRLFVTTTFDPLLERALNGVRFSGRPNTRAIAYSPENVLDLSAGVEQLEYPTVYHLLGKLSSMPDYAVTDEDTLEFVHHLQTEERRPRKLFDALMANPLLLIGSRFPNWLARFFVRTTAGKRLPEAKGMNFIADLSVRDDPGLRQFLTSFSARTLVYEDGGPLEFVDELYRRWSEEYGTQDSEVSEEPRSASGPTFEVGSVFISYASEDAVAARSIAGALEEAGLAVWFDKQELAHGDAWNDRILGAIRTCSAFVPVISKNSATDGARRYFRKEWKRAVGEAEGVAESRRFIMPVLIDDTGQDTQAVPDVFRARQWANAPAGACPREFVQAVKEVFKRYQMDLRVSG